MKNLHQHTTAQDKNSGNNRALDNTLQHASYGKTTKRKRFPKWLSDKN
ncbi:hypothetical protein [Aquimarina addita]